MRTGYKKHIVLIDRLLFAALVEARSCERFKLLSEGIQDDELRDFYRKLMISEAGHYTLFIKLARLYMLPPKVRARWFEWLAYEAQIMSQLSPRGDRMH